jgi:flagellar protein FliS
MLTSPLAAYRQAQAGTASRTQLVVMLYEGILRFCTAAELAARNNNIAGRHEHLVKAQAILAELLGSLNFEQGGEVAVNLGLVYDYCHRRLVEANLRNDPERIAEVRGLVAELLPAWREVARQEQATAGSPAGVREAV